METLNSNMQSEDQFSQPETGRNKGKHLPKTNGPQFTIPRLKKIKRDLLTELAVNTHECQQEILTVIRNSFNFPFSNLCHAFNRVQSVHNPDLTAKYLERRRDMKSNGYPDALVADTYAFMPIESPSTIDKLCREGVKCGNQQLSGLGVSHMAVHVCKHADILSPSKPKCGDRILLMVKLLKGKVKTVLCKNVGAQLEPTPNYDCHIAKPNVDQAVLLPPHLLFYSSQLYVYEYGDFQVEDYPRQVLPYAVVYYSVKEPQMPVPKTIASLPHPAQIVNAPLHKGPPAALSSSLPSAVTSSAPDSGPNNEVWRGRLHLQLVEGGHIYIEVAMLSYFVPLTVTLISPIKIHSLYPEHNAQFTFFGGLSNIANKDEVEWRAHYFRYCVMRPRPNNEEHFKALIKHISTKREMPTVRLPQDVFLFLMPDCLLASQLGLVRREDESPALHCIIMSKYSTCQSQTKRFIEKKIILNNYGSSTTWEGLFDDSDLSDEDENAHLEIQATRRHVRKSMTTAFREQKHIQNKFTAMSLNDAEMSFSQCACKKVAAPKSNLHCQRDDDVCSLLNAMQSVNQPNQNPGSTCFPPGSRHKPKQKVSRRAKAMPSFSPHGSSDSDTDNTADVLRSSTNDQYSLLNNTKTVEEELSEEELTNEQMEDIIFLRKPVSASSLTLSKTASLSTSSSYINKAAKQPKLDTTFPNLKSSYSSNDLHGYNASSTIISSKPKIIPTEPIKPSVEPPAHKPKIISEKSVSSLSALSNDIATEPKNSTKVKETNIGIKNVTPKPSKIMENTLPKKPPKSILKSSTKSSSISTENCLADKHHSVQMSLPPPIQSSNEENDFGDVDMRVPNQQSTNLHPIFLSAKQSSLVHSQLKNSLLKQFSPNLLFGSWLAPGDMQPPPLPPPLLSSSSHFSSPFKQPVAPVSPSVYSPLSSMYSPASPTQDSPASPPSPSSGLESESPASPPQSMFADTLRSSPVAIPTSRIHQNDETPTIIDGENPLSSTHTINRSNSRERIDNADEMKNFLNSEFDSDFDSSYEDER